MSTTWNSTKASTNEDTVIQILLIGKSGNGKSSAGNAVLGKKAFEVTTGINTCTEHTQLAESVRTHQNSPFTLQVTELPDVCNDMDGQQQTREIQLCKTLTFPAPTVVCLVVRADVRFTPAEYATYLTTWRLLETQANEEGQTDGRRQGRQANKGRQAGEARPTGSRGQVHDNLVLLFTMGDNLSAEQRKSFDDDIKKTNKELQQVLKDAKGRFVLLSKEDIPHDDVKRPGSVDITASLSRFLDFALQMHRARSLATKPLRAMLLGIAGGGKSATGNSLLHPQPQFPTVMGLSSATNFCQTAVGHVSGYELEVTDTPGVNLSEDADALSHQIHNWLIDLHHAPDVLLFVIKACDRFQESEYRLFQVLKDIVGNDINNQIIVVFTGGDKLVQYGKTMEHLLMQAPGSLVHMLNKINNRYVVIDNRASSVTDKLIQRNSLLEAIVRLADTVKANPLKLAHTAPGRHQALQRPAHEGKHDRSRDSMRKKTPHRPSNCRKPSSSSHEGCTLS